METFLGFILCCQAFVSCAVIMHTCDNLEKNCAVMQMGANAHTMQQAQMQGAPGACSQCPHAVTYVMLWSSEHFQLANIDSTVMSPCASPV